MIKVRILSDVTIPDQQFPFRTAFAFQQGETPEVPAELASEWIRCGLAAAVIPTPIAPPSKSKAKRHVI